MKLENIKVEGDEEGKLLFCKMYELLDELIEKCRFERTDNGVKKLFLKSVSCAWEPSWKKILEVGEEKEDVCCHDLQTEFIDEVSTKIIQESEYENCIQLEDGIYYY